MFKNILKQIVKSEHRKCFSTATVRYMFRFTLQRLKIDYDMFSVRMNYGQIMSKPRPG